MSDLPDKNCWPLAQHAGDVSPDKMQRLLERAVWDEQAAMRAVRGGGAGLPGRLNGAGAG
jgi:hypothetical protein